MATKKQIAALREIIANAQYLGLPEALCGVQKLPRGGYLVTDGFVAVIYEDAIASLEPDTDAIGSRYDAALEMFEAQYRGDSALVTAPIESPVKLTALRKKLIENGVEQKDELGNVVRDVITLKAEGQDGKTYYGSYDVRCVRRAVEAVGGKPMLYIGYGKRKNGDPVKVCCLLVEQEGSDYSLEHGSHALVMPVRV